LPKETSIKTKNPSKKENRMKQKAVDKKQASASKQYIKTEKQQT
jgi:hypothetical protein